MAYDAEKSRFDFEFSKPHRYVRGQGIFLGYDRDGEPAGFHAESHCLGIAGTGGGKTTGVMVPNILKTLDNVFCIDPTGAVANAVWEEREAHGQRVYVIDPFHITKVPDRVRASYNPLHGISTDRKRRVDDLRAITAGLVLRSDDRARHWDDGAEALIAGIAAHLMTNSPPHLQTLGQVRAVLRSPRFDEFIEAMAANPEFEGLAQAGAAVMKVHQSEAGHFRSAAVNNTMWLDSPAIKSALEDGFVDLTELKTGSTDIYVVIPKEELAGYSRFLRLFVSLALRAMQKTEGTERCLFIIDEFYALGKLPQIQLAFAAGRSSNIRCWPFVQDMGQLEDLYGKAGMRSFFANASLHLFFAVDDEDTLKHISDRLGEVTVEDLGVGPHEAQPFAPPPDIVARASAAPTSPMQFPVGRDKRGKMNGAGMIAGFMNFTGQLGHAMAVQDASSARAEMQALEQRHRAEEASRKAAYDHRMKTAGKRRIPPDEIKRMIGKPGPRDLARSMIVFASGGEVFNLRPWRWDLPPPPRKSEWIAEKRAALEAELAALPPMLDPAEAGKEVDEVWGKAKRRAGQIMLAAMVIAVLHWLVAELTRVEIFGGLTPRPEFATIWGMWFVLGWLPIGFYVIRAIGTVRGLGKDYAGIVRQRREIEARIDALDSV